MKPRVLVVDDEPNIRRILQAAFDKSNMATTVAESAEQALEMLQESEFDVVLTDVTMPGISGYELQVEIRRRWPLLPVIIMTAYGTIPQAIAAIRNGAFEFVTKPFDLEPLKKVVLAALRAESKPLAAKRNSKCTEGFVAKSTAMVDLIETVKTVADSRATVLVSGESGVGKEVLAKMIHQCSPFGSRPFVAVNCAAIPDTLLESELFGYEKGAFTGAQGSKSGKFEQAEGGTLFLDEIGEIPLTTQVKLLRVLQEREFDRLGSVKPTKVNVRLITATNRDLRLAVESGIFRLDLLYRLQVIEIAVPPLRERIADIEPLALHFLTKFSAENNRGLRAISASARAALEGYAWPGNVRELENTIERAVVLSGKDEVELTTTHLPANLRRAA